MLKLVRGALNSIQRERSKNSHFFLHCTVTQQSSKFLFLKQNTTWKQTISFFIEYGTVARLQKRTEYCMPALWATQSTKTIFTVAIAF